MKDVHFLLHEPLLEKFRVRRAYDKKVKKAIAKKNRVAVDRLISRKPTYKLDRIVLERYPRFVDALRDLDDCLTRVHLFASLSATAHESIDAKQIHTCQRLCHEWQAYVSRTHSLRKTFISVKGIYYEAEVQGQKILWLAPHALQQVFPQDVDDKTLINFLEFDMTLLTFINYKLYNSIQVTYPPTLDPRLEALAADLYALSRYFVVSSSMSSKQLQNPDEADGVADKSEDTDMPLAELQLLSHESSTLKHLVEDENVDDMDDDETKECKSLFKNQKFFLSREVPRESLLFVIPAFGGLVSWDGEGAPFQETDDGITHQIVDKPTQGHIFLSREYVQPQWVYDCINARIILPIDDYIIGRNPPPHLSPFVDNETDGYVPDYAEKIKRLQAAARKEILPMPGVGNEDLVDPQNALAEGVIDRTEAKADDEKKKKLLMLENQHREELNMEMQGKSYSSVVNKKLDDAETPKEDSFMDTQHTAEDDQNISKAVMSRKNRKLYEAMQINRERKKANIALLKERKKKADAANKVGSKK